MSTPQPVLVVFSILAGLKALLLTAEVAQLIGDPWTAVALAVLLAIDVGAAFYTRGQVVPLSTTVVYEPRPDRFVTGGAATEVGRRVSESTTIRHAVDAVPRRLRGPVGP